MKRFYRSDGILRCPHAITRLDHAPPPAGVAQLSAAAFGVSYAAASCAIASDERKAHGESFNHSRSTRNTGRA